MDYAQLFSKLTNKYALYNIMPLKNIPSVITHGILSYNSAPHNHKSIADPNVQSRRNKSVPGGLELHSYASLYFDPRNPMMYKIHDRYKEFCILGINATILNIEGVVIADCNAASNLVKFLEPNEMQDSLDFDIIYTTNWNDSDEFVKRRKKSIKCSEVLVPDFIPYSYVVGAYVADNSTKKELQNKGFNKLIKINPDKFFQKGEKHGKNLDWQYI